MPGMSEFAGRISTACRAGAERHGQAEGESGGGTEHRFMKRDQTWLQTWLQKRNGGPPRCVSTGPEVVRLAEMAIYDVNMTFTGRPIQPPGDCPG